jgi:uncharacterized damage-inducible protein DinB
MIDELVHSFDYSVKFMEQSVADLTEEQMVQQPASVPNHAAWTLGHIINSCEGIAGELSVEKWLPENWESRFGYGSTPLSDNAAHPPKAELVTMMADASDRLRKALLATDPSRLQQPLPDPQGCELFPTMSHVLLHVVVAHTAFHAGQIALWRRAMGLKSVAVYI